MAYRSLEDYKKQFDNASKDKIIEMNYEMSKRLCELEKAFKIINDFINNVFNANE